MKKKNKLFNTLRTTSIVLGVLLFIMLLLALTPLPFYMHYSLGTDPNQSSEGFEPDYIVMLGGGGMPSQSNLIRLHYTAEFAIRHKTDIIILHPDDSNCQAQMQRELACKGIDSSRITFLKEGANTHSQVLNLKNEKPDIINKNILVITSPEHLTRTIKCFNKLDFTSVRGKAAFEGVVDFGLSLKGKKLKGNKYIPNIESTRLRYTFWNYLKLEIDCFKEYFALAYYKLKGCI